MGGPGPPPHLVRALTSFYDDRFVSSGGSEAWLQNLKGTDPSPSPHPSPALALTPSPALALTLAQP